MLKETCCAATEPAEMPEQFNEIVFEDSTEEIIIEEIDSEELNEESIPKETIEAPKEMITHESDSEGTSNEEEDEEEKQLNEDRKIQHMLNYLFLHDKYNEKYVEGIPREEFDETKFKEMIEDKIEQLGREIKTINKWNIYSDEYAYDQYCVCQVKLYSNKLQKYALKHLQHCLETSEERSKYRSKCEYYKFLIEEQYAFISALWKSNEFDKKLIFRAWELAQMSQSYIEHIRRLYISTHCPQFIKEEWYKDDDF